MQLCSGEAESTDVAFKGGFDSVVLTDEFDASNSEYSGEGWLSWLVDMVWGCFNLLY